MWRIDTPYMYSHDTAKKTNTLQYGILSILGGILICVWGVYVMVRPTNFLKVVFFDVGQGDAIFIETPNGVQVLVDGGPSKGVLRSLGGVLKPWDRSLDIIIVSHPDMDHIGGLPSVLERFSVGSVWESGVLHDSTVYETLHSSMFKNGLSPVLIRSGERYVLDENIFIDVLFPDRDVFNVESNTASSIVRLVYGDTSFLLTGDSPKAIEGYLVDLYAQALESTVLKLGHHGSKTSTSEIFLSMVNPQYAVISAGKDNQYGHPHKEVIEALDSRGIMYASTAEEGNVIFTSDGVTVSRKQ